MPTPSNLGSLGLGLGGRSGHHGTPTPVPTTARSTKPKNTRITSSGAIRVIVP